MKRWFWIMAVMLAGATLWAQEGPVVREIKIEFEGPETVNRTIVMSNIRTAVGKALTREMVEQDVRNLISTGYFYDVRVSEEPITDGVRVKTEVTSVVKSILISTPAVVSSKIVKPAFATWA